jgi:hypothetical protein
MNAIAPARVAMCIWGKRYSEQNGGAMDFWDKLTDSEKKQCIAAAELIRAAPMSE